MFIVKHLCPEPDVTLVQLEGIPVHICDQPTPNNKLSNKKILIKGSRSNFTCETSQNHPLTFACSTLVNRSQLIPAQTCPS